MPSLRKNNDGSPHLHTYVRADTRYDKKDPSRYKCADPFCTHSEDRKNLKFKAALCAPCFIDKGIRTTIILDHENLCLSRPRCQNCANTRKAKEKREVAQSIAAGIAELFPEATPSEETAE